MKKLFITLFLLSSVSLISFAQQFKVSAEIRPRFEARHGFKTLSAANAKTAAFVSQRSRLNFDFKEEKLTLKLTAQNVRIWGDVPTLTFTDKNGMALHETWAHYQFNDWLALKVGRQEIAYDDQRIFGAVGWAQQARSHDAVLILLDFKEKGRLELGVAYNANKESVLKEDYMLNQYKTFQSLHYQVKLKKHISLSILGLNNGLAYITATGNELIANSQTLGTRMVFKKNKINADFSAYYQMGLLPVANSASTIYQSAYLGMVNFKYDISDQITIGVGGEIISGNPIGDKYSTNTAFNPYYGTNHKFNGLMDYFFVGNHANSSGLIDLYIPLIYKKNHFKSGITGHYFMAANTMRNTTQTFSSDLGFEADLTFAYQFSPSFNLKAGYSQLFGTKSLEFLKGGSRSEINNWGWVMLIFKPMLFEQNKQ